MHCVVTNNQRSVKHICLNLFLFMHNILQSVSQSASQAGRQAPPNVTRLVHWSVGINLQLKFIHSHSLVARSSIGIWAYSHSGEKNETEKSLKD